MSHLGHTLARSTIADVLRRHGIGPAHQRGRKANWKEFLTQHWELIVAADFFTVEVWTARGLKRFLVLFFIDLSTRKVEVSSAGEFQPDALSEPYVNLSAHTAPAMEPRRTPICQ